MTEGLIERYRARLPVADAARVITLGEGNTPLIRLENIPEANDRDINLYITSPGGVIRSGFAIYDTMKLISPDVSTICLGMAASMASFLLAGGAKGKRYALPNSTIHTHQAMGGAQGQASDIEIAAREILRLERQLNTILAENTGQPYEKVAQDSNRDFYLTAEEALEYGWIDEILTAKKQDSQNG